MRESGFPSTNPCLCSWSVRRPGEREGVPAPEEAAPLAERYASIVTLGASFVWLNTEL
jgi:hypothetical protein